MIYLDNAATTKPSKEVLDLAEKFNNTDYFNPSALYRGGLDCAKHVKEARLSILNNLKTKVHDVIFTASGSEADNMAIFCAVKRGVFVTDKGEHSAVYQSFLELKNRDKKVEFIDLNNDGSVNTAKLYEFVENNNVDFVSIVHVNNETGAINDINTIAKKLKSINPKIIFHSDGVQAYGKIKYKLSSDVDLYSISAHKINGLKGVGALIKKSGLSLSPLIFGGGQENGIRSGTENVFGIKVFEFAGCDKYLNIGEYFDHVSKLKEVVLSKIDKNIFTVLSGENSSPYIISMAIKGVRGEVLMHSLELEGVIVGNGSACSSKNRLSRVMQACGHSADLLDGVIRISFSVNNTVEECELATEIINRTAKKLKGILGNE